MKPLITVLLCIMFMACRDDDDKPIVFESRYHIFCWPSKTPCSNQERGLELSYDVTQIAMGTPPTTNRVATLICCRYVRELMDTLRAYNEVIKLHYKQRLNNFDKRHRIGPDLEVYSNYSSDWQTGKSFFNLGFIDHNHAFGFNMFVPMLDAFDPFYNQVIEQWEECCPQ